MGEINEFQKLFLELDIGDSVVSEGDMTQSVCLTLLMAKLGKNPKSVSVKSRFLSLNSKYILLFRPLILRE